MSKQARQADQNVIAIVQPTGTGWRGMIVSLAGARPAVVDCREWASDIQHRMHGWIDEHRAAETIAVLPAAHVVCRTCSLPVADAAQLEQALQLQAEAHLLGTAPPHRTGMGVLDPAPGETSRTGIILAWPEATTVPRPETAAPLRFAPDVAALAALLDGARPDQALVWADRGDGSVAIALTHGNGGVFRATREALHAGGHPDGHGAGHWARGVGRVLAETALNVGHTPSFVEREVERVCDELESLEPLGARLLMPDEVLQSAASRISGAPAERRWWSENGILVGVALARAGSLRRLTTLQAHAPTESPSPFSNIAETLAKPRTAATLIAVAVLLAIVAPIAASWLRLQVLQVRYGDIDQQLQMIRETRKVRAMYQELDQEAWTMTKLLADISCCMPKGIKLEMVRIEQGGEIAVQGIALPDDELKLSAPQVLEKMNAQLQETRIFDNISVTRDSPTAYGKYDFTLTAKVVRPHLKPLYPIEQDFGEWTLGQRERGEEPGDDTALALEDGGGDEETGAPPARRPEITRKPEHLAMADEGDEGDGEAERSSRPRPAIVRGGPRDTPEHVHSRVGGDTPSSVMNPEEIPEPLTQEQVDRMDDAETMLHMQKISKARKAAKANGDEALDERLRGDFKMILERRKQIIAEKRGGSDA